jgi:hypothetical protein
MQEAKDTKDVLKKALVELKKLKAERDARSEAIAIVGIGLPLPRGWPRPSTRSSSVIDAPRRRDQPRCPRDRWDLATRTSTPNPDASRASTYARWRRLPRRHRPLRRPGLRHLAARGAPRRPAAAPAPRGRVGGPRRRRSADPPERPDAHRRVRRHLDERLQHHPGAHARGRSVHHARHGDEHRREPHLVLLEPRRPERRRRHRVLVVPRRRTRRVSQRSRTVECESAIAAGVNCLILPYEFDRVLVDDAMLSPDGRCKTFDARGERLRPRRGLRRDRAEARCRRPSRSGDRIYALVRGSASTRTAARTASPSRTAEAQEALIVRVADAGRRAPARSATSRRTAPARPR